MAPLIRIIHGYYVWNASTHESNGKFWNIAKSECARSLEKLLMNIFLENICICACNPPTSVLRARCGTHEAMQTCI